VKDGMKIVTLYTFVEKKLRFETVKGDVASFSIKFFQFEDCFGEKWPFLGFKKVTEL